MTTDQVTRFFHEAGELAGWKPGIGNALVINYLTHFATLVRNSALEEAWQAAQPDDAYQDEWFKAKADACRRINLLMEQG